MKIKRLLRNLLILFSSFILILVTLFCLNIIVKDFNYGHKSFNVDAKPINWISYYYSINKKQISNFFNNYFKKETGGLPKVEINISKQSLSKLLSDIPSSTKKYVKAKIKMKNIEKKVDLRYMGDNPVNWMFDQKAIRIRTEKSEMINRKRYFEYRPSQRNLLDEYIAYKFAKKLGLIVSDVRLVDLILNNKKLGIFIERENLNESFLRRKKIMPVNLYKGEASRNSERKVGISENLDDNPRLWKKISFLNSVEASDYSDLKKFSNNIRKADNSYEKLKNLLSYGNDQLLAKTAILEILLNSEINDNTHNRRLVIDTWSGKKHIIPHDFGYSRKEIKADFNLDFCSTRLFCILNQSSEFLDIKYDLLHQVIKHEKIFENVIKELEDIKFSYLQSLNTDLGVIFRSEITNKEYIGIENEQGFNELIRSLKKRKKTLLKILEKDAKFYWKNNDQGFEIIVKKSIPLSNLLIEFENDKPENIVLDYNNNKTVDKNDKYFYPDENGKYNLNLKLFANRILINENNKDSRNKIHTGSTSFVFFTNKNFLPKKFITFNNFTKKQISMISENHMSSYPNLHNKVIMDDKHEKIILNGNIFLKDDLIINNETEISEGTIFNMGENVSIIFKKKVIANGSIEKPIIFKKNSNSNNWGTIAFHGSATEGSIFKNIIIENGSGESIDGVNYFSALSVHSAKDIVFDNILIKDNSKYDDMMHIIYSENIQILNSKFLNAHLDSIDVDISNNIKFKNSSVIRSGNDGIDFMESNANLENMIFLSSDDKAISVGENSKVSIKSSRFKDNKFGVVSKDLSKVFIENSIFEENKIQLSTYQKNWRYGNSGTIEIKKSDFRSPNNNIISDKFGKIDIISSDFEGEILKSENVNIF